MRKFTLITLALITCIGVYAQKPKPAKANALRMKGDLAGAKEIIDQAIEYEKTKEDGKTWYYRGLIYATIDTSSNPQITALSDNAMEEAIASFNKANELQGEGKDYFSTGELGLPVTMTQQINGYYSYYYNKGVNAFEEQDYEEAVEGFELAQEILPEDSNAYINAALAAHSGELWDKAIRNYDLAIEKGGNSRDVIFNYLNVLNVAVNDSIAAYNLVQEAKKLYPNDPDLLKNEINLLIRLDSIDQAKDNLLKAIEAEPENVNLQFTLAILYEQLDQSDKALETYDKALEIDPNHFASSFNKGVLLIEKANEVIRESNNLGVSKADLKRARELEPVIEERLRVALPQWEKTAEIDPKDQQTLETLMYIYKQLGMMDKAEEMMNKLDSL